MAETNDLTEAQLAEIGRRVLGLISPSGRIHPGLRVCALLERAPAMALRMAMNARRTRGSGDLRRMTSLAAGSAFRRFT